MKKYTVKTQEEWNAIPINETENREIWIENSNGVWIYVSQIENATVHASGSATVHAWGSATVRAWDSATKLYGYEDSVFILHNGSSMTSLTNEVTVKVINKPATLDSWISKKCVQYTSEDAIIYKRVSSDFKTQEGTKNETLWIVGCQIEVPNWTPDKEECGEGKFHACDKPWHCDEFRSNIGDKYIAIKVRREDMKFWPNGFYPNKVAFKKGFVMYECDIDGNEIRA